MFKNLRKHTSHICLLVVLAVAVLYPQSAAAAKPAPAWKVTAIPNPSTFFEDTGQHATECAKPATGHTLCDKYDVLLENVGGATSEAPFTVTIKLPEHVSIVPASIAAQPSEQTVCEEPAPGEASCTFEEPVVAGGFIRMRTAVLVEANETEPVRAVRSTVTVSGGAVPDPPPSEVVTPVGEGPTKFGVEQFSIQATGPAGEVVNQAGGHPSLLTTTMLVANQISEYEGLTPLESIKNLVFYLPLGFVGNARVAPRCPAPLVEGGSGLSGCPPATRIGNIIHNGLGGIGLLESDPTGANGIYNVEPEKGTPAEYAFPDTGIPIFMYTAVVRHHGAYMLRVDVPGIPRIAKLYFAAASFFGDLVEKYGVENSKSRELGAFLTNPSDCSAGPLDSEAELTTWGRPTAAPIEVVSPTFASIDGCNALTFAAGLHVTPDTTAADQPSGYSIDLEVPQAPNFGADVATPPVKNVTLTLPEGVSVSPGAADGLGVCQSTGPEGINIEGAESEEVGRDGLKDMARGKCPASSQVADVTATVPILPASDEHLQGHIYLAAPKCGATGQPPCNAADAENGNLFSAYLELVNTNLGIVVKLPGKFDVNATTGRITARFVDNPQFPLSNLEVHTSDGPRAALANPQSCGTATTTSDITPWSAAGTRPDGTAVFGTPDATPSSQFTVGECSEAFSPTLSAGSLSTVGGGYTPFTLTVNRSDGSPDIERLTTTLPPGLTAAVAHVAQCPEAQANAGSCGPESRIGSTTVAVGSGSHPYTVKGDVYFTGPYNGAPFGLSIVVPAVAGPFNLGDVVVRAAVRIDPSDAHVSVETDPLPQIRDGVPLRLKMVNVTLDRQEFTINPTNCSAMSIGVAVRSTTGVERTLGEPFAAGGCKNLGFKPKFTAVTQGKTSKQNGASLHVAVTQAAGEANIRRVELQLPILLPSRLATLQKACAAAQFAANPAGCPAASVVGTGVAHTRLLKSPLTGPAYLVSHGGAEFPDLVFVLQGEGVRIDLVGNTNIKKGITYSRFKTVPDAPISAFETDLPEGPHSVLAAPSSLCAHTKLQTVRVKVAVRRHGRIQHVLRTVKRSVVTPLSMPATIVGQNGAELRENIGIAITGCGKAGAKAKPKAKKK